MSRRIPTWGCPEFPSHGRECVCAACLNNFQRQGKEGDDSCLPPRVEFGRGWFSVGATHWFGATDETVFPARGGRRILAQTVCGTICDVTLAYAPRVGRECRKCVTVLRKLGFDVRRQTDEAHSPEATGDPLPQSARTALRLH